jgi:non-ribosomal peptide synthetase component E (peptide arylation enzyme)
MSATATIEQLVVEAHALGVTEIDLDETIYDLTNEAAARLYNGSAGAAGNDDETNYENLHGRADELASAINNEGLASQVKAMFDAWGEDATRAIIEDAVPD